ncbi:MAG TPA: penicillin acylase family protein [Gemmatimonadaceae bacterium]|nr:penicillin acylase family protein [Gemmatimonadaceae bacterium]
MRRVVAAVVLAILMVVGFRATGPVPPLGPFLDPANGVWAAAAATTFPALQRVVIPGLKESVQVVFDDRGVPHVFAPTEEDAYRALGYVEARDRLFQMEAQTRAAAGRLTEWAGKRALETDRENRALGLVWGAERKNATYDKSSAGYRALAAYSEGVNAYISQMRPRDLPVEYRLLNARPMKWEPIYSLYFLSRMSLTLGFNDATVRRLKAESVVGKAAADALFPVNSPIQQPIQPSGSSEPRFDFGTLPPPGAPDTSVLALARAREELTALAFRKQTETSDAIGSNNWAVSPKRSASGHALLAGDPHLDLTLPSVWYEMHIVVPGKLDVAGVGFPGVPGVVIGFNRDVAWTFTNTGSDVNDYYQERVDNEASPTSYVLDGQWKKLEQRVEKYLDAKGKVIATDTLHFTHRGPMRRELGRWLSMRWTVYDQSHEPDNFISLGHAKNAKEWMDDMSDYVVPTQNGLVADRAGDIAIRSSGRYPIRPGDGRGDVIRDGTKSSSDWIGQLPVDKYPYSMNPPQGFLASANQQPVDPKVNPAYMGSDWYSPWRAMRINALLRADSAVTADDMRLFQTDPGSARADLFVPLFLSAARRRDSAGGSDAALRDAVRILSKWDRRYVRENREAVLFEAAMGELASRTWDELRDKTKKRSTADRLNYPEAQLLAQLMDQPTSEWWDDRATPPRENRDDIVVASLKAAYDSVSKKDGDPSGEKWLWSNARRANINHLLRIPAFSALDIPVQGGPSTLAPSSGAGTQGPSWRMVVELGPEVKAWATYPGGQSGAPSSPRYKDRIAKWTNGLLDEILFPKTPADIDRKRIVSILTLVPR